PGPDSVVGGGSGADSASGGNPGPDSVVGGGSGPDSVVGGGSGADSVAGGSGSELVLWVSDTGAGVDAAHADLVFQRGFSTKPAGEGGRGLGLALVSQAVQRHGGTLTVTEADGGGARFEARLPLGDTGGGGSAPAAVAGGRPGSGGAV
ncbi:sensor histidine kinase, partial [Streptomyces sp. NPDC127164]